MAACSILTILSPLPLRRVTFTFVRAIATVIRCSSIHSCWLFDRDEDCRTGKSEKRSLMVTVVPCVVREEEGATDWVKLERTRV